MHPIRMAAQAVDSFASGVRNRGSASPRRRAGAVLGAAGVAAVLALASGSAALAALDAPLADAAMREDSAAVRGLIAGGADPDSAHGDGMTALHWAAEHGDAEVIALLVDAGADIEARTRWVATRRCTWRAGVHGRWRCGPCSGRVPTRAR